MPQLSQVSGRVLCNDMDYNLDPLHPDHPFHFPRKSPGKPRCAQKTGLHPDLACDHVLQRTAEHLELLPLGFRGGVVEPLVAGKNAVHPRGPLHLKASGQARNNEDT